MSVSSPLPPVGSDHRPLSIQQQVRAQLRQRVRGYKRGLTVAALVGFSALGVLIGHPYVAMTTASPMNSTTTQVPATSTTTTNTSAASSTFLTQQGNGNNGASTQAPATTSGAS